MVKKAGDTLLKKILLILTIISVLSGICLGLVKYGMSRQKEINIIDSNSIGIKKVVKRVDRLETNMNTKFRKLNDKIDCFISDDKVISKKRKLKGALNGS